MFGLDNGGLTLQTPYTTLYGISNCDTVKKARKWLDEHNIDFQFHDFRKSGLTQDQVELWLTKINWESLLNKRGTTWRQLPEHIKNDVSAATIAPLMVAHPTLIKRPVLTVQSSLHIGFKAQEYEKLFSASN